MREASKLIGKTFGCLTVIRRLTKDERVALGRTYQGVVWLCKCLCGNQSLAISGALNNGERTSCGCKKNYVAPGQRGFNFLYNRYRTVARSNSRNFELNKDNFKKITSLDCFYCGKKPLQISLDPRAPRRVESRYFYNGIDRLDSNLGYTLDNSVPCCSICNIAKSNHTLGDFLDWIVKTYNNLKVTGKVKEDMTIKTRVCTEDYRNNFDETFKKKEEELIVKTAYYLLDSSGKVTAKFSSLEEAMDHRDKYPRDASGGVRPNNEAVFQPVSEPGAKLRVYPWASIQHKKHEEKVQPELERPLAHKYRGPKKVK